MFPYTSRCTCLTESLDTIVNSASVFCKFGVNSVDFYFAHILELAENV